MLTKHIKRLFSKSESSVFFESVSSTLQGYLNPNYVKEFDTTLT